MDLTRTQSDRLRVGRRIAFVSVLASFVLAAAKILIGWMAGSTSVVADGFESASDVVASGIVLFGLTVASKPPDEKHPYGHGRLEMLTGLAVGFILAAAGVGICVNSIQRAQTVREAPEAYALWALVGSIIVKAVLSTVKFHYGRRINSGAIIADAWNDTVDILSGTAALVALGLTLLDPSRFLKADSYGGFVVGLIVIFTALRVARDTSLQLMDTMPEEELLNPIREVALSVPGVTGIDKCYARKTGLQYHVDLHAEMDPNITVRASHDIATEVRDRIKATLDWVADVMVHVEPTP